MPCLHQFGHLEVPFLTVAEREDSTPAIIGHPISKLFEMGNRLSSITIDIYSSLWSWTKAKLASKISMTKSIHWASYFNQVMSTKRRIFVYTFQINSASDDSDGDHSLDSSDSDESSDENLETLSNSHFFTSEPSSPHCTFDYRKLFDSYILCEVPNYLCQRSSRRCWLDYSEG